MSDSKDLSKDVPAREHDFVIDTECKVSKRNYKGNFKCIIPNLKLKALADKKRAELNSGLDEALDPSVLELHYKIAFLRFTLIDSPNWWKENDYGYDLDGFNIVDEVYKEVEKFQKDWMAKVWGTDKDESGKKGA